MIAQLDRLFIATKPAKIIPRLVSYAFLEGRPVLTRGRWINPFVFALHSIARRMPALRTVKMPIFIIGTGRSGTTLLGKLLALHKDVAFLNEPKALWHALYPQEDLIGSYSMGNAYYRLSPEAATEAVIKEAHRIYSTVLTITCSRRIVDKYPEMLFRVPFLRTIFPDAKFLFIARNGWDTCSSIENWSDRYGKHVGETRYDWWGVNDRKWSLLVDQIVSQDPCFKDVTDQIRGFMKHIDRAAVEWTVAMREGLALLDQYPDSVRLVRYEDLLQNQVPKLKSILSFCNLDVDRKLEEYALKMIKPLKSSKSLSLHPVIANIFKDTMLRMGYNA